jgi:hypothetical protein
MSAQSRAYKTRLLRAFLIAPLATPLCVLVWSTFAGFRDTNRGASEGITPVISLFFIFGLPAELLTVVLGIPLFLAYRRFRISSWAAYALGGAVLSQVPMVIFACTGTLYFLTGQAGVAQGLRQALPLAVLCGVSSALVFRKLAGPQEDNGTDTFTAR